MAEFKDHKIDTTPVKKLFNSTLGIAFVVIGVVLLAFSFIASLTTNTLLYIGLLFIIVGIGVYVYGFKRKSKY